MPRARARSGPALLAFAALALALEQGLMQLLLRYVLRPTGLAAGVAARVAEGDLGLPAGRRERRRPRSAHPRGRGDAGPAARPGGDDPAARP